MHGTAAPMKRFFCVLAQVFLFAAVLQGQSSVWKISSENGNSIFLGGSVHILRAEDYPLPAEFDMAYKKASVLVLEADIDRMEDPEVIQKTIRKMVLPENQTLRSVLGESVYRRFEEKCIELGIPPQSLKRFKPSIAVNMLTMAELQMLGFSQFGVDQYYLSKAKEDGKSLDFLESVDFQVDLLTDLGYGYENEYILYSLDDFENTEQGIPVLIEEWKSGGSSDMNQSLAEMKEVFPTVYQKMVSDRNSSWMPILEEYLNSEIIELVIVGLAHLHGPDGLLDQLERRGYTAEQLRF
ncbi:TraB/GumN family protein [Breznakiella homolactica]|uniref:TraB/GumN family protein n=1 Tax=Breznakiella homolactica TaxID=2798577 RepID=A0A7T7XKZ7_9SPIR|nr:TraB/GumN family protein [Breznakiella homolactica]QQO08319.1 TraB/GumN family protein [Breznakiella homolactica]